MSGPGQGWNPDGTPKADEDQSQSGDQQPGYQQPGYGQPAQPYPDQYQPQQPASPYQGQYPSAAQQPSPEQPSFQPPPYPPSQPGWSGTPPDQTPPPPYGQPGPQQAPYYGVPTQPYYPPPQPPRQRRQWLGIAIVVVIAVVVGVALFLLRGGIASPFDLAVGDCIDRPAALTEVEEVQRHPCNEPHDGEVFYDGAHTAAPGTTYPGESEFSDFVGEECLPAFEQYTGMDAFDALSEGYEVGWFYPNRESWDDGNRAITCYVYRADDSKMTASVRVGAATPVP